MKKNSLGGGFYYFKKNKKAANLPPFLIVKSEYLINRKPSSAPVASLAVGVKIDVDN